MIVFWINMILNAHEVLILVNKAILEGLSEIRLMVKGRFRW